MHLIIRVIVHAKDENEALKKGEDILNELVKKEIFDCYRTFESENGDEWKGDWSHLSPVVLASSPEGRRFIDVGWQYTVGRFTEALEKIKLVIQYLTPEQMLEETSSEDLPKDIKENIHPSIIRCYFHELSDCVETSSRYLYFEQEPITRERDLEWALIAKEGLNVYVIPADVHY